MSVFAIGWEVLAVPLMSEEGREDLINKDEGEEREEDGVLEAKDDAKAEVDDDLCQEVGARHHIEETAPRTQITRLLRLVWN